MIIFWIAIPMYTLASIVAFGMELKRGLQFMGFIIGITFLLYLMFFHSTESALGIVAIGLIAYALNKK